MLGEHATQLELVADAESQTVSLFVLDGEAENFVRIEQIAIAAKLGGRPVILKAVENLATGESIGDTSQFEAEAGWLEGEDRFAVEIDEIVVRGQTFSGLKFIFPEGKH